MADPIIEKAVRLKKELEKDTPPEFQAAVKEPMDAIMKILLEAMEQPSKRKPQ